MSEFAGLPHSYAGEDALREDELVVFFADASHHDREDICESSRPNHL